MDFNVNKFKHHLLMNAIMFFMNHMTLKYIVNKPNLSDRLILRSLLLIKFDYMVQYKLRNLNNKDNIFFNYLWNFYDWN
jgi:hypothetical protein